MAEVDSTVALENRPGILMVGSSKVGKRTLLSRLLPIEFDDDVDSDLFSHPWTIDTKYYTADVTLWMANLTEEICVSHLPSYSNLAALVMVFDLNDLKSFDALKKWALKADLKKFDVLVCIGNKVDLVEGHFAHVEYKRRLVRKSEGLEGVRDLDELDYGMIESEGIGLLGEADGSSGFKDLCVEWCAENGIEYVEACASNAEFDKCLSVDGDSQGIERLYGALSAHMWRGMVLKSGNGRVVEPYLPQGEEVVSEESDFEFDYEVLSEGSGEAWNDVEEGWVSANGKSAVFDIGYSSNNYRDDGSGFSAEQKEPLESASPVQERSVEEGRPEGHNISAKGEEPDLGSHFEFEDLERLMSEIGGMRDSLRLMPDFQRREMAAKLALRMAAMFGGESEDED